MAKTKTNTQTLTPQQQAVANVQAKVKNGIGVTQHTSGQPIKGLMAQKVTAKPQAKMLANVVMGKHPGQGNCIKRWHLYVTGQNLLTAKVTNGQTVNDLTFWHKCGYLQLIPASPAQITAAQTAWANGQCPAAAAQALWPKHPQNPANKGK